LVGLSLHGFTSAYFVDRLLERGLRHAGLLEYSPGVAFVGGGGQQEKLGGNVLVAALLRFLVGDVQEIREIATNHHLARRTLDLRQARNGVGGARPERVGGCACLGGRGGTIRDW